MSTPHIESLKTTSHIAAVAVRESPDDPHQLPLQPEHKRAIEELLQDSHFQPVADDKGPYNLTLSIVERRLVIEIRNSRNETLPTLVLSLTPYRRLIQDYFTMIDSYEQCRYGTSPCKLEAIDMGRRALHNEGADLLSQRLADKITIDFETARRLFTLVCALQRRL